MGFLAVDIAAKYNIKLKGHYIIMKYNMNFGWKFFYGTADAGEDDGPTIIFETQLPRKWTKTGSFNLSMPQYNDSNWQDVQLPHDFVIDRGVYTSDIPFSTGSLDTGFGWYRKTFTLPPDSLGKRIFVTFNGIYRDSQLWCNGDIVKRELSGFNSYRTEITETVNYDKPSTLAVFCDATEPEGWWYTGGGIYRDAFLEIVPQLCFVPNGIYIKQKNVDLATKTADFSVQVEIDSLIEAEFTCAIEFFDAEKSIATTNFSGTATACKVDYFEIPMSISNAILWSDKNPHQYTAKLTLTSIAGTEVFEQKFAPRVFEYNSAEGMKLNGQPIFLRGACGHDDFAGVGVACNRSVHEYKINKLIDMGCNAYRCSHNPPDPVFLDICDEKGIIVMDEIRWPAVSEESMKPFVDMIRRDRNHPCIFSWSLCNEEADLLGKDKGVRVFKRMIATGKLHDDTRDYLMAINARYRNHILNHKAKGLDLPLNGVNYMMLRDFDVYTKLKEENPEGCFVNTELIGLATVRIDKYMHKAPIERIITQAKNVSAVWPNKETYGNLTCYGDCYPRWGQTPEEALKAYVGQSHMCGLFMWTGIDYRGETFPYRFPNVISPFGIIDYIGIFKDWAYYFKAHWTTKKFIWLMPSSWDLKALEGDIIKVYAISSINEAELFLNGQSLGKKSKQTLDNFFWEVPYTKGELIAIAYENDTEVARHTLNTSAKEYQLTATCAKSNLVADNTDCALIEIGVCDKLGNFVNDSDILVDFEVIGEGKLLGQGNGNISSLEHDKVPYRRLYGGKALAIVQSLDQLGKIKLIVSAGGVIPAEIEFDVIASDQPELAL